MSGSLTSHVRMALLGVTNKVKTKTELLLAVPARGQVDGENGYFLATPSIVEYFAYEENGQYRWGSGSRQ